MRLMFAARGWNAPTLAMLVGASCGAVALGQVSVELRSGTDFISAVQVLDRMVLVGLALPIAVIVRQLEDRAAWAFATSARDRFRDRAVYLATVRLCVGLRRLHRTDLRAGRIRASRLRRRHLPSVPRDRGSSGDRCSARMGSACSRGARVFDARAGPYHGESARAP